LTGPHLADPDVIPSAVSLTMAVFNNPDPVSAVQPVYPAQFLASPNRCAHRPDSRHRLTTPNRVFQAVHPTPPNALLKRAIRACSGRFLTPQTSHNPQETPENCGQKSLRPLPLPAVGVVFLVPFLGVIRRTQTRARRTIPS